MMTRKLYFERRKLDYEKLFCGKGSSMTRRKFDYEKGGLL